MVSWVLVCPCANRHPRHCSNFHSRWRRCAVEKISQPLFQVGAAGHIAVGTVLLERFLVFVEAPDVREVFVRMNATWFKMDLKAVRIDIKDLNSLSTAARVFHVKPKFMMNRTPSSVFVLFNSF